MTDPRVPKLPAELTHQFEVQIEMLKRRCDAFFEGHQFEARDIASILRKLLYDHGSSSQSVMKLVGLKDSIAYLDSRALGNLVIASAKGPWPRTVVPYQLYTNKDTVPFDSWWSEQRFKIIFKDVDFSREELVLEVANREGGDHVDPMSDRRIAGLNRTQSPWRYISDNAETNDTGMYGFELASICAIGEELLWSVAVDKNEANKRMHNYSAFNNPGSSQGAV